MKILGLCFLIYDNINHERLWYNWLKNIDDKKYKIYIHYKKNIKLKYFEKYKLNNCIETKWGDISLVKAQNLLLEYCITDNCTHTIFLSGACIPLQKFEYIYNYLDPSFSYFNICPDHQCFPICNKSIEFIEKKYIKKANMMSIINNRLGKLIIKNQDLIIKWFDYESTIPDEHCYITLVYYLNEQKNIITTPNTSYSGSTTFAAWSDMDDYKVYKHSYKGPKFPNTYVHICKEEIDDLINGNCLFGRKFNMDVK